MDPYMALAMALSLVTAFYAVRCARLRADRQQGTLPDLLVAMFAGASFFGELGAVMR